MSTLTSSDGVTNQERSHRFVGLTWWSLITLVLAVPVWIVVARSAVLSRVVDGGIFLSVSAGIADGLRLYEQVWDNKDPLFFGLMAIPMAVAPSLAFFMDVLWIALAGLGAGLVARSVMNADRALFVGLVAAPLLMLGPSYVPGWTNTPGTALVLLTLGLFAHRLPITAGLAAGLLAFVKLPVWPIAVAGLALALIFAPLRRAAARALVSMFAAMGVLVLVLALLGWLSGAVDAIGRNRQYAVDVANYFGFEASVTGRLTRALGDWPGAVTWSAAIAVIVVLLIGGLWLASSRVRSDERLLLAAWALVSWVGTIGVLVLTYVWPHHIQALALPTVMSVIVFAAIVPARWFFPVFIVWTVAGAAVFSGWGSVRAAQDAWNQRSMSFDAKVAEIDEVPLDARLLASVPESDFTFARLGSNDDRGFLGAARADATLACPQFHLYDFSPPEAFAEALECIQGVDVVLLTDAFTVFGGSSRAPFAQPVLDYVGVNFTCLRVDDRQVCTRNR